MIDIQGVFSLLLQNILIIFALILVNGFFAAVEMALVTARKSRLDSMASEGNKRAREILAIISNPGTYLATVQVGISLVTTFASAVGGAAAVPILAQWLNTIPAIAPYSSQIALAIVVLVITYLSLVFGELVPKQLALLSPERTSMALIRPVSWLARAASLPIKLLSMSTDLVLRIIAPKRSAEPSTSSEEIESLLAMGTLEGIFKGSEKDFVSGVFDYGDRKAKDVMTARTELVAMKGSLSPKEALSIAAQSGFSRFPIYEDDIDNVLGYVHLKDLIWGEQSASLRDLARTILFIPSSASLTDIYRQLTTTRSHQAIVLDEHGGTAGMLTLEDVLEVIVGEIDDEYTRRENEIQALGPNTWLVDGSVLLEDLAEYLSAPLKPTAVYSTIAGLILSELGRMPAIGDSIQHSGHTFTVRQMDKLRVENILVQVNS